MYIKHKTLECSDNLSLAQQQWTEYQVVIQRKTKQQLISTKTRFLSTSDVQSSFIRPTNAEFRRLFDTTALAASL